MVHGVKGIDLNMHPRTMKKLVYKDLSKLGIEAYIGFLDKFYMCIVFKNQDDLNLYQIAGTYKKGYLGGRDYISLTFRLGKWARLELLAILVLEYLCIWLPRIACF